MLDWDGVLGEISGVYDKAEKNPQIAKLLKRMERNAVDEVKSAIRAGKITQTDNNTGVKRDMTLADFELLSVSMKTKFVANLGQQGLIKFVPSFPSQGEIFLAQGIEYCGLFLALDKLENLDCGMNHIMHANPTIIGVFTEEAQRKLGMELVMLLGLLYPGMQIGFGLLHAK